MNIHLTNLDIFNFESLGNNQQLDLSPITQFNFAIHFFAFLSKLLISGIGIYISLDMYLFILLEIDATSDREVIHTTL